MSWLAISNIDLSAIAATLQDPKGDRRDIGDINPANDGTMRATRQARKRDVSLLSIPLSGADAFAWENLVVGAGHVWSFDSSFYSSKGAPGVPTGTAVIDATVKKYGAASLRINAGDVWDTSGLGLAAPYTVAAWHQVDSGGWHHVVLRSDGAKWVDGVRNDAASLSIAVSAGDVDLLTPTGVTYEYYDDLVVMPCLWPTTWPPLVFAAGAAFSPLPYLTCAGSLVPEAATRTMIGKCTIAKVLRGNPAGTAGAAAKDVQVLQIDLQEK